TADPGNAVLFVQITVVEPYRFAHAQSGRVHRFQNRAIAQTLWVIARGSLEQPANFVGCQKVRQLAGTPWGSQGLGRIARHQPLAPSRAEETSHGGPSPRDTAFGVASLVQRRHVPTQIKRR